MKLSALYIPFLAFFAFDSAQGSIIAGAASLARVGAAATRGAAAAARAGDSIVRGARNARISTMRIAERGGSRIRDVRDGLRWVRDVERFHWGSSPWQAAINRIPDTFRSFRDGQTGNYLVILAAGLTGGSILPRINDRSPDATRRSAGNGERDVLINRAAQLSGDLGGNGDIELLDPPDVLEGLDEDEWNDCFISMSFSQIDIDDENGVITLNNLPPPCLHLLDGDEDMTECGDNCVRYSDLSQEDHDDFVEFLRGIAEATHEAEDD